MIFGRKKNLAIVSRDEYWSNSDSPEKLIKRIEFLDKEITETTKNIFQAQVVKVRTIFSNKQNFLQGFQQRIVENSANQSLLWHQRRLVELNKERKILQDQLDKLTGKFYSKKIKQLFSRIFISLFVMLILFVSILGLLATFYFLPLIIVCGLVYIFIIRNKFNR